MLYVHINEQNKPWIDKVSTEQQEGYEAKPGLLDSQIIALMNYPDKCYVDENGAVITPNQLPLSEAEKQNQETDLTIQQLQAQINNLVQENQQGNADKQNLQTQVEALTNEINQANTDKKSLQGQIANLMLEITKLQPETATGGAK